MDAMNRRALGKLLLVEPQFLFRRAVVAVAREMQLADVHETTNVNDAAHRIAFARYDALIIDLDDAEAALALIARIRNGDSSCQGAVPIAVLASDCSALMVAQLKSLDVRRIVLKPFKVRIVLDCIDALLRPSPAATQGCA